MNLTREEREKFAAYCLGEADTYAGMNAEAEKLAGLEPLIKRNRLLIAAFRIVAKHLTNVEEVTL